MHYGILLLGQSVQPSWVQLGSGLPYTSAVFSPALYRLCPQNVLRPDLASDLGLWLSPWLPHFQSLRLLPLTVSLLSKLLLQTFCALLSVL